ncbi:MAG: InlB B-repeat-containing protein, partial [Phycisphaerae bacterium]|nr:InlB B-repeat-containing protein [Phycisphaerae bacterium]
MSWKALLSIAVIMHVSSVVSAYTVTFEAGPNGSLQGDTVQSVAEGGDCTLVTAVPDEPYQFWYWSFPDNSNSINNPLTVTNVTEDMTITANFTYTTLDIKVSGSSVHEIDGYTGAAMDSPVFQLDFWMSTDIYMVAWDSKLTASESGVFEATAYTVGSPWTVGELVLLPPFNGGVGGLDPSGGWIQYFMSSGSHGPYTHQLVHSLSMVAHLPANLPWDKEYTISTYAPGGAFRSCWSGGDGSQPVNGCFPESQLVVRLHNPLAPLKAIDPSPSGDATGVQLRPVLAWSDGGGATSYDVYLGASSSLGPGDLKASQSGTSFRPAQCDVLEPNKTYYWRIDSKNTYGTRVGDVWHFSTASVSSSGHVVYVNAAACGSNNGDSWGDAYTRLQDALHEYNDNAEVWVAAGTYRPDDGLGITPGDRTASFQLAHSWVLYGGFEGSETSIDDRDPAVNVTILSGDLAGNDGPSFANNGENSYHVVTANTTWAGLVGFTVCGGNANGSSPNQCGGGMFIVNADPDNPIDVRDCVFIGNSAISGGAVYNTDGSPYLRNCVFSGNRSTGTSSSGGGGMYNSAGSPTLSNCMFSANSGSYGGGL